MEVLFLILAVAGIILTAVLSNPAIGIMQQIVTKIKRRQWSGSQYRKGHLQHQKHVAFEEWSILMKVDDNGTTVQEFQGRIINLSQKLVSMFYLPVFVDANNIPSSSIAPWAKSGRKVLPVAFDSWDELRAQGRIAILLVPPLEPGSRRRIKWGLTMPHVFKSGDEYYDWDIEVPYYDMVGRLEFSDRWELLYARWDIDQDRHYDPPCITGRAIEWAVKFPEVGTRLHLKMGLAQK